MTCEKKHTTISFILVGFLFLLVVLSRWLGIWLLILFFAILCSFIALSFFMSRTRMGELNGDTVVKYLRTPKETVHNRERIIRIKTIEESVLKEAIRKFQEGYSLCLLSQTSARKVIIPLSAFRKKWITSHLPVL